MSGTQGGGVGGRENGWWSNEERTRRRFIKGYTRWVLIQRPVIRSGPDPELRTENEL